MRYIITQEDVDEINLKIGLEAKDKHGRIRQLFHCDPLTAGDALPFHELERDEESIKGKVFLPGDFDLHREASVYRSGNVLGKILDLD